MSQFKILQKYSTSIFSKVSSSSYFNFPTLYINKPHDKLLKVPYVQIEFCFKGTDKSFGLYNKYGTKWAE